MLLKLFHCTTKTWRVREIVHQSIAYAFCLQLNCKHGSSHANITSNCRLWACISVSITSVQNLHVYCMYIGTNLLQQNKSFEIKYIGTFEFWNYSGTSRYNHKIHVSKSMKILLAPPCKWLQPFSTSPTDRPTNPPTEHSPFWNDNNYSIITVFSVLSFSPMPSTHNAHPILLDLTKILTTAGEEYKFLRSSLWNTSSLPPFHTHECPVLSWQLKC
jgi:hypothetical protein